MRTQAVGLNFDNLLKLTRNQLAAQVATYALVYDEQIVSDSFLFSNKGLQALLQDSPDGAELLKMGIIKPILNEAKSFRQRHQEMVNDPKLFYGFIENPPLVDLIESLPNPLHYKGADIGANYMKLWGSLMNSDVMSRFGLTEASIDIVNEAFKQGQAAGKKTTTNTFVYDEVMPFVSYSQGPAQGELLMELARSPYSLALPTLYGFGVVAPGQFRGHEILRQLNLPERQVGQLIINEPTVGQHQTKINDRLVSWLLSQEVLISLTPSDLGAIRSSPDRADFQVSLGKYLQDPSSENWKSVSEKLERYLKVAANELFNRRTKAQQISADPTTPDQVSVEGALHQIKVVSGTEHPLNLSDLPSNGEVQVVGRNITLPTAPTLVGPAVA